MKFITKQKKLSKLFSERVQIDLDAKFQRAFVWSHQKQVDLINSIFIGMDIPKVYLFKNKEGISECIDGKQRLTTIFRFLGEDSNVNSKDSEKPIRYNSKQFHELHPSLKKKVRDYELSVSTTEDISDDDLRLMFLRLQIGAPLLSGEKLHAMKGDMHSFIFSDGVKHKFFKGIGITSKRFANEQTLAHIAINSFQRREYGVGYVSCRFEKLKQFFLDFEEMTPKQKEHTIQIKKVFTLMTKAFGDKLSLLRNRAHVLSAYLFVEDLIRAVRKTEISIFAEFYAKFVTALKKETKKGLAWDHINLMEYQRYIQTAPAEPYTIKRRNELLLDEFRYYKKHGKIQLIKRG